MEKWDITEVNVGRLYSLTVCEYVLFLVEGNTMSKDFFFFFLPSLFKWKIYVCLKVYQFMNIHTQHYDSHSLCLTHHPFSQRIMGDRKKGCAWPSIFPWYGFIMQCEIRLFHQSVLSFFLSLSPSLFQVLFVAFK